jgi:hypothetical protein
VHIATDCVFIFQVVFKKNLSNTVLILYQTKPCFQPELDTKAQTKENPVKEKEGGGVLSLTRNSLKLIQSWYGFG